MSRLDPPPVTRAYLETQRLTGNLRPTGTRLMVLGDSITYIDGGYLSDNPLAGYATAYLQGGTVGGSRATGMYAWANAILGGRIVMAGNAGVPGNTSDQMLARLAAVLAIPSDILGVQAGANDWTQGYSAATTVGYLQSIYTAVRASGRKLMVLTTLPRSSMNTTAGKLYLGTVNAWIKNYARTTPGVILADIAAAIVDPTTGVPVNSSPFPTNDGTHLNAKGAQLCGRVIAAALSPHVPATDIWPHGNVDPTTFVNNPYSTGAGGSVANGLTGTPATTWAAGAAGGTVAGAISKVARTDGVPGEWQRITIGAGNTSLITLSGTVRWGSPDLVLGDQILTHVEVRVTGALLCTQFEAGSFNSANRGMALADAWQQVGTGAPIADGTYILTAPQILGGGITFTSAALRVNCTTAGATFDVGRATIIRP